MSSSEELGQSVVLLESTRIDIVPFALSIPPSVLQGHDEPTPIPHSALATGDYGIVGTITLLKKSAMIWFGWGRIDRHAQNQGTGTIAGRGLPCMGQLAVGVPRTHYKGAFSSPHESPGSQLIGGEGSDDEILGMQMASRLSQKLGYPVFISCSLSSSKEEIDPSILAGLDQMTASQRAAALTERHVRKMLEEKGKTASK